jgi:hypothetical protein
MTKNLSIFNPHFFYKAHRNMVLGSEIRVKIHPGSWIQESKSLGSGSATLDPEFYCEPCWQVDLEVGPSLVFLHGTLIRHFMHVKENIFGEDQRYTPMDQQEQEGGAAPADALEKKKEGAAAGGGSVDMRQYRPLNVILDITVHDLQVRWKDIESDFCMVWTSVHLRCTVQHSTPAGVLKGKHKVQFQICKAGKFLKCVV